MRHVVIIGAKGQLGSDLQRTLRGFRVTGLAHRDLDVCDAVRRSGLLGELRPDVVINTSAFLQVDACEDAPEAAFAVNAIAPFGLARLAAELDFTLVHFSSDYVFDGRAARPYTEDDAPNPLNVYGTSKLAGEFLVRSACPRHFVLRTTGLYGRAGARSKGGNFVDKVVHLAREERPVRVVADQVLTPTATADLARAIGALLEREASDAVEYGVYHVTNSGHCSWYEFAEAIFVSCGMQVDLSPITSIEAAARAKRPAYSVLDHRRWTEAGFAELRPWREALTEYLREKGFAP